jgi:ATP-dependent phosphofructokinase / diphosphate-dependent phosphofructokinase
MRIAISTGGGDAPGLNAVIRAVVLSAHARGWESFGILRGFGSVLDRNDGVVSTPWLGLERRRIAYRHGLMPLGPDEVRGITHLGGTILGASNRGNPFRWVLQDALGRSIEVDRSGELIETLREAGIDALVSIGGDGSLKIAHDLWRQGLNVVGVPKTIDNDVWGTETTFGFDTAVSTATDAIDKLHSTAQSHDRVMVVELMGREAGWIALHSGLSGTADVILIPEIPFDIERVCDKIRERELQGRRFSIVVVAEGAREKGGDLVLQEPERAGRAAAWSSDIFSGAAPRRPSTGSSRSGSVPRRSGRSAMASLASAWFTLRQTSPACRSVTLPGSARSSRWRAGSW